MTKLTVALITMLVAGVVPFGKVQAVCQDGDVGVSELRSYSTVSSTCGLLYHPCYPSAQLHLELTIGMGWL
jgi:hypothetical protein